MQLQKIIIRIYLFLLLSCTLFGQKENQLSKPNANDHYNYISINNCKMWVSNNGSGSNQENSYSGFLWNGDDYQKNGLIFQDGLIWCGKVGDEYRVNGNTYRTGLQAGKILADGKADNPSLDKYRVYKIRKNLESVEDAQTAEQMAIDFAEWPVEEGAPYVDKNKDGKFTASVDEPYFIGDEVLWFVSNDMDSNRTMLYYWDERSKPLGLEIQTTVYEYKRWDELDDVVFKKYKIINKSKNIIDSMYIGYWSDPDLGYAADDYVGCDSTLNLAYCYNSRNGDYLAGTPAPAVGYALLKGPSLNYSGNNIKLNLPMTSFSPYMERAPSNIFTQLTTNGKGYTNNLRGISSKGIPYVNPQTNSITKFPLAGDPVAGTGWYEGKGWSGSPSGGERQFLMSSGPFTMAPNDTQTVVIAIIAAKGTSNLNSILELKKKVMSAQLMQEIDTTLAYLVPTPTVHYSSLNQSVKLWWENNAEDFEFENKLITGKNFDDVTYSFEGYRLWQYNDSSGSEKKLLATFDLINDITTIRDYKYVDGDYIKLPVINGTNSGLERNILITGDAFSNYVPLNNYSPYYFGITAYAYNEYSTPSYLESPVKVFKVIPGQERIDVTYPYTDEDAVNAVQVSGNTDAKLKFNVIDPAALTGDTYQVSFKQTGESLSYTLQNKTKDNKILYEGNDYSAGLNNKPVIDGFILTVENAGKDSIKSENTKYRVKSVLEVKGKDGVVLAQPIDVLKNLNSSNKWQIKAKGTFKRLNFQTETKDEGLGYDDYELRFTGKSKYYYSGYARSFNPLLRDDKAGPDYLPFEVWCIGRNPESTSDDYRLAVKIWDKDRFDSTRTKPDSMWTQLENNDWEEIFAYKSSFDPSDPPPTSGISKYTDYKFGCLSISGEIPDAGTVIRIVTYKPLADGDVFEATLKAGNLNDKESAKTNIDKISVFPNPYFGGNDISNEVQNFIRFTSLPRNVAIRIYNIAGVFIRKLSKDDFASYLDWNLQNDEGKRVGSGMYIAHLEMPEIGNKVMKIAVIQEKKYLNSY